MAVLRSESKAIGCSASSLRAGGASARFFGGSRAMRSCGHFQLPPRRGPRVAQGRGSFPSARAVPGFLASPDGPARTGAHRLCIVGSTTARGSTGGGWRRHRYGRSLWSNCVFSRTAGDYAVLNRSLLARGRLTRR
jgi:hypothetical protein